MVFKTKLVRSLLVVATAVVGSGCADGIVDSTKSFLRTVTVATYILDNSTWTGTYDPGSEQVRVRITGSVVCTWQFAFQAEDIVVRFGNAEGVNSLPATASVEISYSNNQGTSTSPELGCASGALRTHAGQITGSANRFGAFSASGKVGSWNVSLRVPAAQSVPGKCGGTLIAHGTITLEYAPGSGWQTISPPITDEFTIAHTISPEDEERCVRDTRVTPVGVRG